MQYKLIAPVNSNYSALEQVLTNRGIKHEDIKHYLNTTDNDINSFKLFGEDVLKRAAAALVNCIKNNDKALVIIDSDCDGFTSSALIINYLHDLFPAWVENKLNYVVHEGKQHGIDEEFLTLAVDFDFSLIIIPDAGTNDIEQCKILKSLGKEIIILDHHICEQENPYAYVINNQTSNYPNKELSGVGVTWQFCRYLDELLKTSYAEKYIDLVALGNDADMMSLTSIETKHLIQKGLREVTNPFISYMHDKNMFSLGEELTPIGVAFYIAPFVNAIVRSGTEEEKYLIFESMLKHKAFIEVPSTKRGHKEGDTEKIVEQAVRVATNVKSRQTKAQDQGMELLKNRIKENNMLEHQVLLFLLEPGEIDKNIAGLVANKIMAIYQKPVCILTKIVQYDENFVPWEDNGAGEEITYQGSARGCDKTGITHFKDICDETGVMMYTIGHQGAFGLGLKEKDIDSFIQKTDELLKHTPKEPIYYVDYIYNINTLKGKDILDIASMNYLWGKDIDEALVAIEGLKISSDMVTIYSKKNLTIKITLPNNISLMMFKASEETCELLQGNNTGFVEINCVGKCNANEWNGNITPQIFCEEYEVIDSNKYFF